VEDPRSLIRSTALLLAVALALALPALLAPIPGGMLASFLPLPFALMSRRRGALMGLLLAALFGIIFAFLTDPGTALHTALVQACAGVLIGWASSLKRTILEQTAIGSGIPLMAVSILSLPPFPELLGRTWPTLPGQIEQGKRLWQELALAGNGLQGDMEGLIAFIDPLFPGFNVAGMMVNCLLCALLAGMMPPGSADPARPLLRSWRLPTWVTWLFILDGFALLLGISSGLGVPAGAMVVLIFLFLVQGLAVAIHRADRWRVGLLPRLFFGAMLIVQPIGLVLLAMLTILGLVDFRFDFRKEPGSASPA
jgi:uncharacterized protein YybS (DUF2232 family)